MTTEQKKNYIKELSASMRLEFQAHMAHIQTILDEIDNSRLGKVLENEVLEENIWKLLRDFAKMSDRFDGLKEVVDNPPVVVEVP
jgi:hypothetical protein